MIRKGLPAEGELVVAKVKKVTPYSAFADMLEYDGEIMIHISEVSSTWVKNINKFLHQGEIIVARIVKVDPEKGYVDASIRRVSSGEKKRRMNQYKVDVKMERLLEMLGKKYNKSLDQMYKELGNEIINKYVSFYDFYVEIREKGEAALKPIKSPLKKEFYDLIKEQVKTNKLVMKRTVEVKSYEPNGVDVVKKELSKLKSKYGAKIYTIGPPRYVVEIQVDSYKEGEKIFSKMFKSDMIKVVE